MLQQKWRNSSLSEESGTLLDLGFPGGSDGEDSACNLSDPGSIPGLGRFPGKGNGYPLQCSCLENSMDRGAWQATVPGVATNHTWLTLGLVSPYCPIQVVLLSQRLTSPPQWPSTYLTISPFPQRDFSLPSSRGWVNLFRAGASSHWGSSNCNSFVFSIVKCKLCLPMARTIIIRF